MREKLINLLEHDDCPLFMVFGDGVGRLADYLIANGVRLEEKQAASEENERWIPTSEQLPENFVSVLGYMTDAGPFPPVRECYTIDDKFYFPALLAFHPVSHWMPLPEPPKED